MKFYSRLSPSSTARNPLWRDFVADSKGFMVVEDVGIKGRLNSIVTIKMKKKLCSPSRLIGWQRSSFPFILRGFHLLAEDNRIHFY